MTDEQIRDIYHALKDYRMLLAKTLQTERVDSLPFYKLNKLITLLESKVFAPESA